MAAGEIVHFPGSIITHQANLFQPCLIVHKSWQKKMDFVSWIIMSQRSLIDVLISSLSNIKTIFSSDFLSGNYSCLVAEFHLHRSIGFHLIQSYLPSILIVSISWVSFWMDVDCVPARVTLGVITLLTVSSRVSGKSKTQLLIFWTT